ncbi:MAG: response regulator [Geminicoccaceae bacterium]
MSTRIRPGNNTEATIMVADSDVLVRMGLAEYLRDCGYRVIEAADGSEVTTILNHSELVVDVLLCDFDLEGGNGFATVRQVRAEHPGVKVILAGGVESSANAAADLCESGPLLARPYDPQIVVDRIKRVLARRKAVTGPQLFSVGR